MKILIKDCSSILLSVVAVGILTACAGTAFQRKTRQSASYYSYQIRPENLEGKIHPILSSIRKVNCYVNYRTYVFGEKSKVTTADVKKTIVPEEVEASLSVNEASSGTALIISSKNNRTVLLTCAHIVDLPDTVFNFSGYSDISGNRYIYSMSVKQKETIAVRDIPAGSRFTVIASDRNNDLAFLGRMEQSVAESAPVNPVVCGSPEKLEWGNELLLAGYPAGQLMLTKGVVSKSAEMQSYFLTDALFNEGFSGGIAMAVNNATGVFELVGIGRSVSSNSEYFLKPEKQIHEHVYNQAIPYTGEVYVNQKKEINYGVTYITSITKAVELYRANRKRLMDSGYNLDDFFKSQKE